MEDSFPIMKNELDWNDLRYFLATIRCGGLSGAARYLGVSIQTVGRRICALERHTGTALFLRHASGYTPTDDGRALEAEAERVEEAITQFRARTDVQGTDMAGVVRLAAPETIATHILWPALQPLLSQHPALELELVTGVRTVGIARGEADIALRLVPPERGALTRRRLGLMSYGLYAAPGTTTDLATARMVGWTRDFDLPAVRWLKQLTGREADIRTTQLEAQRAAIQAGVGIGILPCFLADTLIRIPTDINMSEPLWLVGHAQTATKRIRRVYEEVVSIIEAAEERLSPQY
ncbi:LysR family transcriptional regulator [Pseudomonas asuensis]|uniref:LysR family transcriptional regulator n=2 Tax=Pseudomonas asuensis TaxID=1825787 RepID=A0ABQ2H2I8_9PSED|nr:LysR family transcriptional regulator [Pseudomonas asuensis]